MRGLWARWVARVERLEDRTALTWVRVLVPLAIVGDLLAMARHGALAAVLYPAHLGGIEPEPAPWYAFAGWDWAGPALWLVCLVALPLVSLGVAARPAIVVGVLAYAQLGHAFVPGDRAIDRLLRTVLLVLLFSEVTKNAPPAQIRGWASDLIRWILVLVYLGAGVAKLEALPAWLWGDPAELYTVLADPLAGRLDPEVWASARPLFLAGGWVTFLLEFTAPLLLTRWAPVWACGGALLHLGIAWAMDLGMFSFGMLALYPVLFADLLPSVTARRGAPPAPSSPAPAPGTARSPAPPPGDPTAPPYSGP